MRKLKLSEYEIDALQQLAKVSQMDNWFMIKSDGTTIDLEKNRSKNNIRMIRELLDGATCEDLKCLDDDTRYILFDLVFRVA